MQAAGRVIRTQLDQGIVYLIDDRFTRLEVLRPLPGCGKLSDIKQERQDKPASLFCYRTSSLAEADSAKVVERFYLWMSSISAAFNAISPTRA
ncbi:helicase C-terminal domain-containing protein [Nitrosovibrio sp. Nv6]|uniref:helicase C-terminal domain-containing protein n=1 Tax=Nitrosovibrio sp. Nv6 TaxID=1855340 RepID=UPI0021018201|nr:helicase C-terminal domain-containing protein [Nitrosovibrio sp. Nv6]